MATLLNSIAILFLSIGLIVLSKRITEVSEMVSLNTAVGQVGERCIWRALKILRLRLDELAEKLGYEWREGKTGWRKKKK